MLFAIAAILKPDVEDELIKYSDDFNEQIGPSGQNIIVAGVLRDQNGKKAGYLAFFEGDTIDEARGWVHASPLYRANLYDRLDIFEYHVEVGRLG